MNTKTPPTTALLEPLRKMLAHQLKDLEDNPAEDTLELRSSIEALAAARRNQDTYDSMFNDHLSTLEQAPGSITPADMGRLYAAWNQEQAAALSEMESALKSANATHAETRLRLLMDQALRTVLTGSSAYGQTATEQLELMNPAAADPDKPVLITGPGGLRTPIRHWYQILLLPLEALADRGALNPDLCPVKMPRARHAILEADGSNRPGDLDPSRVRTLTGGFSLWVHHSTPNICRITAHTLRALGHAPESYQVVYHPKDVHPQDQQATMFDAPACAPPALKAA